MFLIGLAIGNSGGDAPTADTAAPVPSSNTEEILAERDAAQSKLQATKDDLAAVTQELKEVKAESAEEQAPTVTEDSDDTQQAASNKPQREPRAEPISVDFSGDLGRFGVADVVVQEARDGTFEVIAVVTNNGPEVDALYLTAKVLSGGEVIGTADGVASFGFGEFNRGATEAVTFFGTDDYVEGADFVELEISFNNRDG